MGRNAKPRGVLGAVQVFTAPEPSRARTIFPADQAMAPLRVASQGSQTAGMFQAKRRRENSQALEIFNGSGVGHAGALPGWQSIPPYSGFLCMY